MAGKYAGLFHIVSARVNSSVGAASFRWQTGAFSTITNATAGTFVGTLLTDYSLDVTEMVPMFQKDGAVAASGIYAVGIVSGSDVQKTWTLGQETALGGASALADVDHWVTFYKRPVR